MCLRVRVRTGVRAGVTVTVGLAAHEWIIALSFHLTR